MRSSRAKARSLRKKYISIVACRLCVTEVVCTQKRLPASAVAETPADKIEPATVTVVDAASINVVVDVQQDHTASSVTIAATTALPSVASAQAEPQPETAAAAA